MPVTDVEISSYRSIRKIRFPLRQLTVLVGGNGVGKTNLYRSLHLLHAAALGTLAEEIARDGGLASVLWAGERKAHETATLVLQATLDSVFKDASVSPDFAPTYEIEIGFPPSAGGQPLVAAFATEAQIKSENLSIRQRGKTVMLMERKGPSVWARNSEGQRVQVGEGILASETALSSLRGGFPEIDAVRLALSSWRFYHGFRTDPESPLRRPALSVTAPMLSADGNNLAAVFATLRHIREDSHDLDDAIDQAFPDARLIVPPPMENATLAMRFPNLPKRAFAANELSDGTLHFLALMGALLSYRLPPFIALNEPETSLHPELLPALARAIAKAAERSQIWVVTHSRELADALAQEAGALPRQVIRRDGATWLEGLTQFGEFDDD